VAPAALNTLLAYPFQLIRLGSLLETVWSQRRANSGPKKLDWQIDAAERAGEADHPLRRGP